MNQHIVSQFGNPRGPFGRLVGVVMALKNRSRSTWAVEEMQVNHCDAVLEIGTGPGATLNLVAARTSEGFVAGIDHSATMVRQARKRNRKGIAAGKITVTQASVSALPFPDNHFDKVFTINSMMFWPDPVACLQEVQRVLKPRGTFSVFFQPHGAKTTSRVHEIGEKTLADVRAAGFEETGLVVQEMKPVACLRVAGVKPWSAPTPGTGGTR
ncbi:MAG: class I SAM-dependent methyltransferase [Ignavibacteria bacterium]|nr:class I SAM-dependent methyltransferase [Ignavibacteria bacterium]